jgi:RNA polymerase sigma factor (sigma-70 family)
MGADPTRFLLRQLSQWLTTHVPEPQADHQLLQRFVSTHDEAAFAALLERHGPMVLWLCRRLLREAHQADDAFQATFLILARKAHSIRGAVGAWLHGVAYRVACRMRAAVRQRNAPLAGQDDIDSSNPPDEVSWREVCDLLHEELERLPQKYKAPLVLCYLQGQTRDEVAQQLGLPLGTLKLRLEQGKDRLRARLARRGVELSAALLTVELTAGPVTAELAKSTVTTALNFATGMKPDTAAISIIRVAEGVMTSMALSRLKFAALLALTLTLVGSSAGLFLRHSLSVSTPDSVAAAPGHQADATPTPPALADRPDEPLPAGAVARMGSAHFRNVRHFRFSAGGHLLTLSPDGVMQEWDIAAGKVIRQLGEPPVKTIVSPDGRLALVCQADMATVWDLAADKAVVRMPAPAEPYLRFSDDGTVITAQGTETINQVLHYVFKFWDTKTGKAIHEFREPEGRGLYPTLAPNGKAVALLKGSEPLRLVLAEPDRKPLALVQGKVASFCTAFSGDSKMLAARLDQPSGAHEVCVWDVATGKERYRWEVGKAPAGHVLHLSFSPDGRTLAATAALMIPKKIEQAIHLWDLESGKKLARLDLGHKDRSNPTPMTFTPDGKLVASMLTVKDTTQVVCLWETATGKELHRLDKVALPVYFAPDGKTLAARVPDGDAVTGVEIWDVATGRRRQSLPLGEQPGRLNDLLIFSPDGKFLAIGAIADLVRVWDLTSGKEPSPPRGHQEGVYGLAVSVDSKSLTTWGIDRTIRQWETATGRELRRLPIPAHPSSSALSTDGRTAAYTSPDKIVHLIDLTTGKELRTFEVPGSSTFTPVAFSRDARLLALHSAEGILAVVDTATGKELRRMTEPTKPNHPFAEHLWGAVFSPDGDVLITARGPFSAYLGRIIPNDPGAGKPGAMIRLWKIASGKKVGEFETKQRTLTHLAISPDGRTLATVNQSLLSGNADGMGNTVSLWETTTGRERCRFKGGLGSDLAFAPDGRTVAVAEGKDRTIRLWDVYTAKDLGCFPGHPSMTAKVVFAPDGKTLMSGGWEGTALAWDATRLIKPRKAEELDNKQLEVMWADLADADAGRAFRAMGLLAQASPHAATWLGQRVKPAAVDGKRLAQLVADLESNEFGVRQKASEELEKLGDLAEAALLKVLAAQPPLETKQRIENLLDKVATDQALPVEALRALRVIEALEGQRTPEAREALKALAAGTPGTRLTREAQASLVRFGKTGSSLNAAD